MKNNNGNGSGNGNGNNVVTVLDSICGSGKTTYIFDYMKSVTHDKNGKPNVIPPTRFIYVTPFLKEIERLKKENSIFKEPVIKEYEDDMGKPTLTKKESLIQLLGKNKNIAMTHILFIQNLNLITDLVKNSPFKYELIIDESPDIFELFKLDSGDVSILKQNLNLTNINESNDKCKIFKQGLGNKLQLCSSNEDSKNTLQKGSRYDDVYYASKNGNLYLLNQSHSSHFISVIPFELIKVFHEVKILTYMFKGQFNELYLKAFGFEVKYQYVEKIDNKYQAIDGFKPYSGEHLQNLITIVDPKKHDKNYEWVNFAIERDVLSSNWHKEAKKYNNKKNEFKKLQKGIHGFYRKCKATHKDFMFTTYIDSKYIYKELPYGDKDICFCSCSARATNDYANKTNLAYMINYYNNSNINQFTSKLSVDIKFNREIFSLSNLIQWIFRSAIRNNEPINLYIPSSRMRNLLKKWLNGNYYVA